MTAVTGAHSVADCADVSRNDVPSFIRNVDLWRRLRDERDVRDADRAQRIKGDPELGRHLAKAEALAPRRRAPEELIRNDLYDLAKRTGTVCGHCGVELAPGEPVWRRNETRGFSIFGWSHVVVPVCRTCVETDERWEGPRWWSRRECPCGRVVYNSSSSGRRFCCDDHFAGYQRESRRQQRVTARTRNCERCGVVFVGTRTDSRYCSNACRQAAYRARSRNTGGDR